MEIICFYLGTIFYYTHTAYSVCALCIVCLWNQSARYVLWFFVAAIWGYIHQQFCIHDNMPRVNTSFRANVYGYVDSIPIQKKGKTQFEMMVKQLDEQPVRARMILSCYQNCPTFKAGEYWKLAVKLQKPRNFSNPGGFDYVNWLAVRHVQWTGQIIPKFGLERDSQRFHSSLLVLRERLALMIQQLNLDDVSKSMVHALTLGIGSTLESSYWDLFRRTGTTHLMVISGAHIGLIASMIYKIIHWIWCRLGVLCLWMPAPKAASFSAIMVAIGYAFLAGIGIPAQRAVIAFGFMSLKYFMPQRFNLWQAWRYALLFVIALEPHSVLMPGFYLSFIAVAILASMGQRATFRGLKKIVWMQCSCLVGLLPFTLFWFSYGSINGFFANLLAIPWVGIVVVPLALLVLMVGSWCSPPWLMWALSSSIHGLIYFLNELDRFSSMNLTLSVTNIVSLFAFLVSLLILVFFPFIRFLPLLIILLVSGMFPQHHHLNDDEVKMDVLDVGQGLAVVIRTANHVLVYDTGMKFYRGGDIGQRVLIPYLRFEDVKRVDTVVISHPDLDHRGGLASLEQQYPVRELIVDNPKRYSRGVSCHQHKDWVWDGVLFHFFSNPDQSFSKNNSSCVLQISNSKGRILLTGDIEQEAESYFVQRYGNQLKSELLVVPHHGSKTSSSNAFLGAVSPIYAVASYGMDNRYHFPHTLVMNRYHERNIVIYDTVSCGMTRFVLNQKNKPPAPVCYRDRQ